MLTMFEVENYKNFKKRITIDFRKSGGYKYNLECLTDNIISKSLIYGRNASGKTNLGRAIMDICDYPFYRRNTEPYTNANSDSNIARFKYTFEFNANEAEFEYEKDESQNYISEKLVINNEVIYNVSYSEKINIAGDMTGINVDPIIVKRFFLYLENRDIESIQNRHPSFLRWIVANSTLECESILISIVDFIDKMQLLTVSNLINGNFPTRIHTNIFNQYGDVFVAQLEEFFNLMGVECKLVLKTLPDGEKQLYFNHSTPIPFFDNASSGTIALYNLFRRIIFPAKEKTFLYLDEFDAFYHYEMSENILKYLTLNFPNTQIIVTTHNTNLMTNRLSRPDCLFILSVNGRITSLNNATMRELREGHNLEKLYISGEFEKYE